MPVVDNLSTMITLLIALSVATERFVEIVKGLVPWLDVVKEDVREEGRRRAALQALAAVGGIVVSALSFPISREILPEGLGTTTTAIALGLLASGGSGFWNSILGYVMSMKALKSADALRAKVEADQTKLGVTPGLPVAHPVAGRLAP
jgi:hypothetical protein